MEIRKRKVGIVGYGQLGTYLTHAILTDSKAKEQLELGWIWNRSKEKIEKDSLISPNLILKDLKDLESKSVDIIIEVCHPNIVAEYGELFLKHADFIVGSPTSLADPVVEKKLRDLASKGPFGCYVPSGALWGAEDIQKLADRGNLGALSITMKKHPLSLLLEPPLKEKLDQYINSDITDEFIVYHGPVKDLCPLAPNNVNTMACAAIAGHNLGFSKVTAKLVADKKLEAHIVEIEIEGPSEGKRPEEVFRVSTKRYNPAKTGAVTGSATYVSFLSSLLKAKGKGSGFHFC